MSYAERMARADGCPACVNNVETPRTVAPYATGGFRADYLCSDCRTEWFTDWSDS